MSVDQISTLHQKWSAEDASATIELLQTFLPHFEPKVEIGKYHWWSIELPCPADADYQFSLAGEPGGERQIHASPIGDAGGASRFWYCALELADFRDNATALQGEFLEVVRTLVTHPTRITEKKGVFWLSYRAQYQDETGWRRLTGGASYLGLGAGIPFIGTKRTYKSPAIVSWSK